MFYMHSYNTVTIYYQGKRVRWNDLPLKLAKPIAWKTTVVFIKDKVYIKVETKLYEILYVWINNTANSILEKNNVQMILFFKDTD